MIFFLRFPGSTHALFLKGAGHFPLKKTTPLIPAGLFVFGFTPLLYFHGNIDHVSPQRDKICLE
jgi:hypothetical protein